MTKLSFDSTTITSRLIPKLEETLEVLKRVETRTNSTSLPSGFASSEYKDAVLKLKKLRAGLENEKEDLFRAVKNFEQAGSNSTKNVNAINFDVKIEVADAVIEIN